MKITHLLAIIFVLISFAACDTEDPKPEPQAPDQGDFTLRFEPYWEDEPLTIGEVYNTEEGFRLRVENLDFYISDVTISKDGGANLIGSEIALLLDESENMEVTFDAEAGNYSGLSFAFGIPSEVNTDSDPTQFPNAHPLSVQGSTGMFWTWNTGYIFTRFDGRADTTGTEGAPLTHPFAFHCGNDLLYQVRDYPDLSFEINENENTVITLRIQVDQILTNSENPIDIREESLTHSSGEAGLALAEKIVNNFYGATTLE
jgi:hypothetical protein